MGHGIDLQQFWTNHIVVNDNMIAVLKRNLDLDPDLYGLQIVTQEDHVRAFRKRIPNGQVAWLAIDRRLPRMSAYSLNTDNVHYSWPDGDRVY